MDRDDLIARVEAATGDDADLMREAFNACYPAPAETWGDEWQVWFARRSRFIAMLNAEAYESAALTLVPEGYAVEVSLWPGQTSHCEVIGTHLRNGEYWHTAADGKWRSQAPTPALAICIASLKARP